jgi:hypothetical protein
MSEFQRRRNKKFSGETSIGNELTPLTLCLEEGRASPGDALTPSEGGRCVCPQPVGAAGCGPKYPRCNTCGYTWHCKTCGGCRWCSFELKGERGG